MEDGNNLMTQNSVTHTHLKIVVFLVVTPCSGVEVCRCFRDKLLPPLRTQLTYPDDKRITCLWNVDTRITNYTVSHPRTQLYLVPSLRTWNLTSQLISFIVGYAWPPAAETTVWYSETTVRSLLIMMVMMMMMMITDFTLYSIRSQNYVTQSFATWRRVVWQNFTAT